MVTKDSSFLHADNVKILITLSLCLGLSGSSCDTKPHCWFGYVVVHYRDQTLFLMH